MQFSNHSRRQDRLRWLREDQSDDRVQHLLSLLPERDRTILTLRSLQGYSAPEIAAALGTSAGHIRVLQ